MMEDFIIEFPELGHVLLVPADKIILLYRKHGHFKEASRKVVWERIEKLNYADFAPYCIPLITPPIDYNAIWDGVRSAEIYPSSCADDKLQEKLRSLGYPPHYMTVYDVLKEDE